MSVCSAVSLKIYEKEQGHDTMGCMNIIMVVLIVGRYETCSICKFKPSETTTLNGKCM